MSADAFIAEPDSAPEPAHARTVPSASDAANALPTLLPLLAFLFFAYAVLRNAWLGDDSFVTFRAIDNLLDGHGWTSDPPQRVQGFTSMLWGLVVLVPYALGANIYWAAMGTALACSLAAAALLLRNARGPRATYAASAGVLWLALSSAYVDFSTSGLENPLAHLLLVIFFSGVLARSEGARVSSWPFFVAALIGLNRQDHLLLVLPALAALLLAPRGLRFVRPLKPTLRAALIGLAPFAAWLVFATIYYGFPFPNTAYAKLTTEIPASDLFAQGVWYAWRTLRRDPLTLIAIALAVALTLRERSRVSLSFGLGIVLYVAYVLSIGGDFMAGRFFTAPLIVAMVWLIAGPFARSTPYELAVATALVCALGLWLTEHMQADEKLQCNVPPSGVVNERHCYFEHLSLPDNLRGRKYRDHPYYARGKALRNTGVRVVEGMPGMMGFAAGPKVHLVDPYALTDPLLARIPFRPDGHWRIGHFPRPFPAGYLTTLETGRNVIADPCVRRYYDALSTVIRGPIWRGSRFIEIWKLNTGRYDLLLRGKCRRLS